LSLGLSGAAGGPWAIRNEKNSPNTIQQIDRISGCVVACAEMLLMSKGITGIDQFQITEQAGIATSPVLVAKAMTRLSGITWRCTVPRGQFDTVTQTESGGSVPCLGLQP